LLGSNSNNHPSIQLASGLRCVISNRLTFSKTDHLHARGINALTGQSILNAHAATLRKSLVVSFRTRAVSMTGDLNRRLWILHQNLGDTIDLRISSGL